MYIIGIFLVTNEVEVIPEEWLSDPSTLVKSSTLCWWPPYKSSSKSAKAVISREKVDKATWSEYSLKVLGRYETYNEARRKAADTSNLESDEEVNIKRKRKRNIFLLYDDVTSEEDLHEETKLPMPPKYKQHSKKHTNQEIAISATEETPISKALIQDYSSPRNIGNQACSSLSNITISHQDFSSSTNNITISNKDCPSTRNTTKEQNHNLQSTSDPLMLLRRDVLDIKFKLNRLIDSFDDLKDKIIASTLNSETTEQSTEEWEAMSTSITNKFPMSEEDLESVENILENIKIKNNLISYLKKYGGNNIKSATFTLLRLLFTDVTASKYSYVGAKKKKVFSSLRVFEAMSDAIRARFKDATVQEISVHVKTWLRNAPMRILLKQKQSNK